MDNDGVKHGSCVAANATAHRPSTATRSPPGSDHIGAQLLTAPTARVRLWTIELQKHADETDLAILVYPFPPGTSKWNEIEHRMFCRITQNWRGKRLTDYLTIVSLIGATTTKAGLKIERALDAWRSSADLARIIRAFAGDGDAVGVALAHGRR